MLRVREHQRIARSNRRTVRPHRTVAQFNRTIAEANRPPDRLQLTDSRIQFRNNRVRTRVLVRRTPVRKKLRGPCLNNRLVLLRRARHRRLRRDPRHGVNLLSVRKPVLPNRRPSRKRARHSRGMKGQAIHRRAMIERTRTKSRRNIAKHNAVFPWPVRTIGLAFSFASSPIHGLSTASALSS
jgi:hypothetical protein